MKLLLELDAHFNAADDNGETVLHDAAHQSFPKLVQLHSNRHADMSVWKRENKWDWTPLMIAEGHRPGNFRPSPETIAAIESVCGPTEQCLPRQRRKTVRPTDLKIGQARPFFHRQNFFWFGSLSRLAARVTLIANAVSPAC